MRERYTKDVLAPVVARCTSWAEVARSFGLPGYGSGNVNLKNRAVKFGIDFSHFIGNRGMNHVGGAERKGPEEILCLFKAGACIQTYQLRRALLEVGVPHRCKECGQPPEWNGKPLVLQVDHINGIRLDCRKENLRFLCPNCHSQTPTWGYRSKQQRMVAVVQPGMDAGM